MTRNFGIWHITRNAYRTQFKTGCILISTGGELGSWIGTILQICMFARGICEICKHESSSPEHIIILWELSYHTVVSRWFNIISDRWDNCHEIETLCIPCWLRISLIDFTPPQVFSSTKIWCYFIVRALQWNSRYDNWIKTQAQNYYKVPKVLTLRTWQYVPHSFVIKRQGA